MPQEEKKYTEEDLRKAFYEGREQACLPDEKATRVFIRPTFNGYLRELDGNEDPHANFKQRCDNLIDDKDYDLKQWKEANELRELQNETKKFTPVEDKEKIMHIIKTLSEKMNNGENRWVEKYEDADSVAQTEMEGYQWALNDVLEKINQEKAK